MERGCLRVNGTGNEDSGTVSLVRKGIVKIILHLFKSDGDVSLVDVKKGWSPSGEYDADLGLDGGDTKHLERQYNRIEIQCLGRLPLSIALDCELQVVGRQTRSQVLPKILPSCHND